MLNNYDVVILGEMTVNACAGHYAYQLGERGRYSDRFQNQAPC